MFTIFHKKKFLVDCLKGHIDIHNHILPGIDDGAKNIEDSIALLKGFADFGVVEFISTPHIMHNYYPNTPKSINQALSNLRSGIEASHLEITISAAAEHMIDSNFETILEEKTVMPLGLNYLLIEMSFLQASINFESALEKIANARYFPILAHPERYVYLHNKLRKHKKLKADGLLFQLNILSLSEYYGKEVQKMTLKMLDEGLFDFIASDVHNMHQLNSLKEMKISSKLADKLIPIVDRTAYNFK